MRMLQTAAVWCLRLVALAGTGFCAPESQGAAVFRARCAACHGSDGAGKGRTNTKMHPSNLTSREVQSQSMRSCTSLSHRGNGTGSTHTPFSTRGCRNSRLRRWWRLQGR
ncbi:MAG: c-type cytochrome [Terriglobales bacterium]